MIGSSVPGFIIIIYVVITNIVTETQTTNGSSKQLQRGDYWTRCVAVIPGYRNFGKFSWSVCCNNIVDIKLEATHRYSGIPRPRSQVFVSISITLRKKQHMGVHRFYYLRLSHDLV